MIPPTDKIRTAIAAVALTATAAFTASAYGQAHSHPSEDQQEPAGRKTVIAPSFAWKLLAPLGLREESTIDTLFVDYSRRSIPSEVSDAWATTGNYGAQGLNMIFDHRAPLSDFYFRDAVEHWLPSHDKTKFYNTRIPMTLVGFTSSGGRENAQELLSARFSGNINPKAQAGAMLDYLYSKGSYANQAVKDLNWGFSGSYLGDRYEFQGFYYHYNLLNKENGGITDMLYIKDPAELQGGVTTIDAKSIPTQLSAAHNRVSGQQLYLNNRYKVGYWHEEQVDDTTTTRTYIPVSSFIYTLDFRTGKHIFIDDNPNETKKYFEHTYLNPDRTHDKSTYWTLSNTFGVSLLEGFHKYAKFGLAAYITHQVRHYAMPADTIDRRDPQSIGLDPWPEGVGSVKNDETEQLAYVGAQLTKMRGLRLRYEATAELGILGPVAGDVRVNGRIHTQFPLLGDSLRLTAFGSFNNEEAPYLTRRYRSNHFIWHNDFGKRRTLRFGGTVSFPVTGTSFTAAVNNLQNHIYFGTDGMPVQHGGNVQVLSLALTQNFTFGIFHWDNRVTYQTTSNDAVIPLPALAVYSNIYLLTRIATLHLQVGVDCDWYTRYYAPSYQPATVAFTNQREYKIGNYPFCNVYANMKLSKTRFFVMYSHFNQGLFGGANYFSMPYYPLNPSRFQIGLSVDFAN